MAAKPAVRDTPRRGHTTDDDDRRLRLKMKPQAAVSGYVDGAWWPHSRELPAELPALLDRLSDQLGPVERVGYNLNDWERADRKIHANGKMIRLGGFRFQHPNTVDVISAHHRLTLLVIPPTSDEHTARQAMDHAASSGDTHTVEELLAGNPGNNRGTEPTKCEAKDETATAHQRWEHDGGRLASSNTHS